MMAKQITLEQELTMKTSSPNFCNKLMIFALIFCMPLISVAQSPGQWSVNGPDFSAEISAVIIDDVTKTLIHMGTLGPLGLIQPGLFRTTNGGVSWASAPAPLDKMSIESMFRLESTLFVSGFQFRTNNTGIYFSIDRGVSWERLTGDLQDKIAISMISANGVYFASVVKLDLEDKFVESIPGVYRSLDSGASWQQAPELDGQFVTNLLFNPFDGRIYAGTGSCISDRSFCGGTPNGVYVSEDGGDSWSSIAQLQGLSIETLVVNEDSSALGYIYAGTTNNGLFYTPDGINWFSATPPLNGGRVKSILAQDTFVFASYDSSVYRSGDSGVNWSPLTLRPAAQSPTSAGSRVTVLHSDRYPGASYLFAGTDGSGVFRSIDAGNSWEASRPAPMDSSRANVLVSDADGVDTYVGTIRDGLYRSPNGSPGSVWVPTGKYESRLPTANVFVQERTVLAYGLGGIYRSADAGLNWQASNPQMNVTSRFVSDMTFNDQTQTYFAALAAGRNPNDLGVWKSLDGVNWEPTDLTDQSVNIVRFAFTQQILYAGSESGLFYSEDGGNTFTSISALDTFTVVTLFEDDNTALPEFPVFAGVAGSGADDGLFSGTSADSWSRVNDPDLQGVGIVSIARAGNRLYAGSTGQGIFYSSDNGNEWEATTSNLGEANIFFFASVALNDSLFVVAATGQDGMYYSSDEGVTWQLADIPAVNDREMTGLLSANNVLYASSFNYGVMRSLDGGKFWRPLVTGLTEKSALQLGYMPLTDRLFLSTAEGVFIQDIDLSAPFPEFILSDGSAGFYSNRDSVRVFLFADEADSMLVSQDLEAVQAGDTGWQSYSEVINNFQLAGQEGTNKIYARFKDYSWNLSGILQDSVILDKTRPAFAAHTPPTLPVVNQEESVFIVQQVDEPNLEESEVLFRRIGDKFSTNNGSFFFGDSAEIDYAFLTNRGLDYRINSKDLAGNSNTLANISNAGDSLTFFSLPVQLKSREAGKSRSLPGGTTVAAFSIVSLPMNFDGTPNARTAFGDLGKYGPRDAWQFWTFEGNNRWRDGEGLTMQPGSANFIIVRESRSLTNSIAGTSMPTAAGVRGEISGWTLRANDWTLIGNPYNTQIKLNQLKLQNQGSLLGAQDSTVQVWAYEGGWKNQDIALEAWNGLMVWSAQADQIVFANRNDPFAEPTTKSADNGDKLASKASADQWRIPIGVVVGDQRIDHHALGVHSDAASGLDNQDRMQLPSMPGGVVLGFPHPEWQRQRNLSVDMRSVINSGERWDLEVKANSAVAVTLIFDHIDLVPEKFEVLAYDELTGLVRDLRVQPELEINIPRGLTAKTISVLIGEADYLSQHVGDLNLAPREFLLKQNYPNPFNPATTIRYGLPAVGQVTLIIYDLLGREVMILEDKQVREPGFYESVVDMQSMSSGVYFYRLTVDGEQKFQAVKRMLLIK